MSGFGTVRRLFVELPFEEEKTGYTVDISVSGEHELVRLTAIYHYRVCYAQIDAVIEDHRARQLPNS